MQYPESENKLGGAIQNVQGRLAVDGELQVKVTKEIFDYYKNDPTYKNSFSPDGWYSTNAIVEVSSSKIKILKYKNNDPQVSTTENLVASDMKMVIEGKCHYVSSSIVIGADGKFPVAILFPNMNSLTHPNYEISPLDGCFCPRDVNELGKCLSGCLNDANCEIGEKFSKVKIFLIVEIENI
jgi:long-subunit acyl-CoA synthetase (AMP-forming)